MFLKAPLLHTPGKVPLLAELSLLVMMAWMVAGWLLPGEKTAPSTLMQGSADSTVTLPDLAALLNVPLFGESATQVQPPKPVVKAAPPIVRSPLTIKLLGTAVAGKESAAIISISSGSDQRVFFVGDMIQAGVRLHKVEPWAIVVDHAGVLERISLEQGAKLTAVAPMPVKTPISNPAVVQQRMERAHVQQQLDDLPTLLSQARVVPNYSNGKPDGFVISEIVPGSLYQQAGLQNGDVILRVNGKRISSAMQAMSMYKELQDAAAIDLELLRAGQMKQVHYVIR